MRTNTKAVLAADRLGDHWGTHTFWTLAMIIRGGGTCHNLGGGGEIKINGQPWIVDKFSDFHVAMYT